MAQNGLLLVQVSFWKQENNSHGAKSEDREICSTAAICLSTKHLLLHGQRCKLRKIVFTQSDTIFPEYWAFSLLFLKISPNNFKFIHCSIKELNILMVSQVKCKSIIILYQNSENLLVMRFHPQALISSRPSPTSDPSSSSEIRWWRILFLKMMKKNKHLTVSHCFYPMPSVLYS